MARTSAEVFAPSYICWKLITSQ